MNPALFLWIYPFLLWGYGAIALAAAAEDAAEASGLPVPSDFMLTVNIE